ncbi:hypothetical protein [Mesobacillus zeae]|uniref:hypothetical protein n=1 Tax=Mesobacillus zeae TaxID=1917180 RepID=UPI00300AFDCB
MEKTLKFENQSELFDYLTNQLNFRAYNLEIGFEEFENDTLATNGSSSTKNVAWETFEWKDENESDIKVEIAFIANPLDEDCTEFEDYYLVYTGK